MIPAQFESFVQTFINKKAVAVKNVLAVYVDKTGKVTGEPTQ